MKPSISPNAPIFGDLDGVALEKPDIIVNDVNEFAQIAVSG
jgi:hypothetical protein